MENDAGNTKGEMKDHWNKEAGDRYWNDVTRLKRILRYILPRCPVLADKMGILGSAALHWYQNDKSIGPKWNKPRDVDLFVSGYWGSKARRFLKFVHMMLKRLTLAGYTFTFKHKRNVYALMKRVVHIVDIEITGIDLTLSFVQSPCCANLTEVADTFDIDICRVIYLIHSCSFVADRKLHDSIKAGEATVEPIMFPLAGIPCRRGWCITRFQQRKVLNSMIRVNKYCMRGFRFTNGRGIAFVA